MAKWKWYSASGILLGVTDALPFDPRDVMRRASELFIDNLRIGDRINVFEENEEGNPERFPLEFLGQMKRFPLLGGPAAAEALMWGVQ